MELKQLEENYRKLDIKVGDFGEKIGKLEGRYSDMKDATDRLHLTVQGMASSVKGSTIHIEKMAKIIVGGDIDEPDKKGIMARLDDAENSHENLRKFCEKRRDARARKIAYIWRTFVGAVVVVLTGVVVALIVERFSDDKKSNPTEISED